MVRRWMFALVAGGLWLLLFAWLPWQTALAGSALGRTLVALLLFCVPGFCLHALLDEERELDLALRLPAGLCLSVGVTGLLGFFGCVAGLPSGFVSGGLLVTGLLALVLLALRGGLAVPARAPRDTERLIDLAALGAALLLTAWLCVAPSLGSDDLTHVARVAAFQQRPQLGFGGIAFGGDNVIAPRYWLAFWPLVEAVLSTLADVQPLELTTNHLGGLLGFVGGLAVFNLARTLGLSRRLAVLAVLAQTTGLLLTALRDQPGLLFFNRVAEDKFFAFFVLAPIVLQIVVSYLERPARRTVARVVLAWLALLFSHPTSLGMVALVVGGFCALELLFGARREAALVLAVIVPLTGAAAVVRFVPHVYHQRVFFDVETASEEKEVTAGRKRRVAQIPGTRFYGIGPAAVGTTGRVLGVAVLGLALLRVRRQRTARYVAAALGVVAAAVFPYTGWILGSLLTPFHLWRILCLVPFGIGTAFVLALGRDALARRLASRPELRRRSGRLALAACGVVLVALPVTIATRGGSRLTALSRPAGWQDTLVLSARKRKFDWKLPYDNLEQLARVLQDASDGRAVLIADRGLNDLVPSLSAGAALLVFRSAAQSTLHAGIPLADARRRWDAQSRLTANEATPEEAAAFLADNGVELVLTGEQTPWLHAIPAAVLPRTLVARVGALELYRLGASARPS